MALNAGTQITTGLQTTEDGVEQTFAINHLSHWLIHNRLSDRLAPGSRVVVTCSGTHDPDDPIAKKFGFRGGIFPSADEVAKGILDPSAKPSQANLDRYATSKMANVMQGLLWANSNPDRTTLLFDPGLMPGTGLARDRGIGERFAWVYIMPILRVLMKGISTPSKSASMLASLLLNLEEARSGDYIEYSGRKLRPWKNATDSALQDDLDRLSQRLTESWR
jgi:protochlorophyllide reductase